jgi:hypothetical protein
MLEVMDVINMDASDNKSLNESYIIVRIIMWKVVLNTVTDDTTIQVQ